MTMPPTQNPPRRVLIGCGLAHLAPVVFFTCRIIRTESGPALFAMLVVLAFELVCAGVLLKGVLR